MEEEMEHGKFTPYSHITRTYVPNEITSFGMQCTLVLFLPANLGRVATSVLSSSVRPCLVTRCPSRVLTCT